MIIIDVNLLLYAENLNAPQHPAAKNWWEAELAAETEIGLDWVTILGFVRMSTNKKIFPSPLSVEDATARMDLWLQRKHIHTLTAGSRHWDIFKDLVGTYKLTGNSFTDAHLAAIAIENDWELYSSDGGFSRFSELRWVNPIEKATE